MSQYESSRPTRTTYKLLKQTGPDWFPAGVPRMENQVVAASFNLGYKALTHAVPAPSAGYFDATDAYNVNKIKNCGYRFLHRRCDGDVDYKQ